MTKIVTTPFAAFVVSCTLLGYILFTDTHSRVYRAIGGALHGVANLAAAFTIAWHARHWVAGWYEPFQTLAAAAMTFTGGWIAGPILMGLYLLISLNVFGRHSNEAFSALAIADFKHFLRMRIDPDGTLTLFPIGLRRVPRRWKTGAADGGSGVAPDDPRATAPELIEDPIVIRPGDGLRADH